MGACNCSHDERIPEKDYQNDNFTDERNKIPDYLKRKYSTSAENSDNESEVDKNMDNKQNSNSYIKNSVNNNEKEEKDDNFDEQEARNFVKFLLENDVSFYKDLIPTINSLSSKDFKALFEGNFDYNYKTPNKAQIKRLAHKFDNFYYILLNCYKDNQYHKYFKELWIGYPYIEDLKNLKDDDKISSKLSSTLPNYESWPENCKEDLIKLIKNTELISSKEIKNKIKDEYIEIDKILKKLTSIKQTFSADKDEEYLTKNDEFLNKEIDKFYNCLIKNSEGEKNRKLTNEEKEKIRKEINQEKNDFAEMSPYLDDNIDIMMESIIFSVTNGAGNFKSLKDLINGVTGAYKDDWDEFGSPGEFFDDDDYSDLDEEYYDDNQEAGESDKEAKEWLSVAKNFISCFHKGYKMFQTINLSKKIIEDNKYRAELDKISEDFTEYQNSKRLDEKDPIKNLKIINDSIDKIEKIRDRLLKLIEKLKIEIDKNINKKKGIIGNIICQVVKLGKNIFDFSITKNPIHLINIGLNVTSIVFCGIDMSYTNDIIDEIIQVLKDAKVKQKEIETELESLHTKCSELKKAYPTYYKKNKV